MHVSRSQLVLSTWQLAHTDRQQQLSSSPALTTRYLPLDEGYPSNPGSRNAYTTSSHSLVVINSANSHFRGQFQEIFDLGPLVKQTLPELPYEETKAVSPNF